MKAQSRLEAAPTVVIEFLYSLGPKQPRQIINTLGDELTCLALRTSALADVMFYPDSGESRLPPG